MVIRASVIVADVIFTFNPTSYVYHHTAAKANALLRSAEVRDLFPLNAKFDNITR